MKSFTVNVGGQTKTLQGPDDATQEQAQAEADRQFQAQGIDKDFSGETGREGLMNPFTGQRTGILGGDFGASVGRKAANFAQGAAELVGGPAQLMGATPGPGYQQAEKEPTDTGDKIARFAGATLPLSPLSAIAAGAGVPGWLAGAAVPRAVGAVEGASAPADTPTQRAINTGVGAITGGFGRGAPGSSALDRLFGTAAGMMMGHGLGGAESMFSTYLGGKIGSQVGPEAHSAVASFLRQFPPSVVARAIAQMGEPFSKMLADEYDYMSKSKNGQAQNR